MRASPTLDRGSRLLAVASAALAALPLWRLIPLWLGLCLLGLGALAAWSAAYRPWPLWLRVALTLVVSTLVLAAYGFGFGRDTGSAMLLAMLALKLGECGSLRDARSLAGFALFALFAAFLQDQGPLTLLLALPALAMSLAAFSRLAEREAGLTGEMRLATRVRQALAWLLLALPLALAGFWFYPRLAAPLWGVPDNALARTGVDEEMRPGDYLDLLVDDSPAFRVRFFGPEPDRDSLYWRGPVLWDFDGRSWTRSPWLAEAPPAELLDPRPRADYEVMLEPTEKRLLFALDLPLEAPAGGRLDSDFSPFADAPVRGMTRYRLRAVSARAFEPELRPAARRTGLRLPEGFNPRTLAQAQRLRQAHPDPLEYIRAVLDWFHRDLSYSLAAPPLGRHSADEFLFDTRVGFCEHFSSAFTILMRAAGIPARVVTGYVGGYRNRLGGHWLIQQSDAHAWAEVWLPGRGWLRTDPTAAVSPARVFNRYPIGRGPGGLSGALAPVADLTDWLRRGWNEMVLGFDAARQRLLLRPLGVDRAERWQLLTVFAASAALALGVTLWGLRRQGPAAPADPLLAAWRRLCARLARRGLARRRDEPAQPYVERIAPALVPDSARVLRALSRRFVSARYAYAQPARTELRSLCRELRRLRPRRAVEVASPRTVLGKEHQV